MTFDHSLPLSAHARIADVETRRAEDFSFDLMRVLDGDSGFKDERMLIGRSKVNNGSKLDQLCRACSGRIAKLDLEVHGAYIKAR